MVQPLNGPRIFIDSKEIALEERLEDLDAVIAFLQEIREQIRVQLDDQSS